MLLEYSKMMKEIAADQEQRKFRRALEFVAEVVEYTADEATIAAKGDLGFIIALNNIMARNGVKIDGEL